MHALVRLSERSVQLVGYSDIGDLKIVIAEYGEQWTGTGIQATGILSGEEQPMHRLLASARRLFARFADAGFHCIRRTDPG